MFMRVSGTASVVMKRTDFITWCRRRDSNSHSFRHYPLKIACLPIPPRRLAKSGILARNFCRIFGLDRLPLQYTNCFYLLAAGAGSVGFSGVDGTTGTAGTLDAAGAACVGAVAGAGAEGTAEPDGAPGTEGTSLPTAGAGLSWKPCITPPSRMDFPLSG